MDGVLTEWDSRIKARRAMGPSTVSKSVNVCNELELIRKAQHGDIVAFEQIVLQYEPLVSAYAQHLLEDPFIAEDVAQDAFLQAFRKLGSLRNPERFAVWLKSIVWRSCRAWVRQQQAARRHAQRLKTHLPADRLLEGITPFEGPEGADGDAQGELAWLDRLEEALRNMGKGRRMIFALLR